MSDNYIRAKELPPTGDKSYVRVITQGPDDGSKSELPSKSTHDHLGNLKSCVPIKAGVTFNLDALARTEELRKKGAIGKDSIYVVNHIDEIFIRVGGNDLMFDIASLPHACAVPHPSYRSVSVIDLVTKQLLIDKNTVDIYGNTPAWTKYLAVEDTKLVLNLNFMVNVDVEAGIDCNSNCTKLTCKKVESPEGSEESFMSESALRAMVGPLKVMGFHLNAYYTVQ